MAYLNEHDIYHNPTLDGPVEGCTECEEELREDSDGV